MLTTLHLLRYHVQPIPCYQLAFKPTRLAKAEQQRNAANDARIEVAKMALRLEGMPKAKATPALSADQKD